MTLSQILRLSIPLSPQSFQILKQLLPFRLFLFLPLVDLFLFSFDLDELGPHRL